MPIYLTGSKKLFNLESMNFIIGRFAFAFFIFFSLGLKTATCSPFIKVFSFLGITLGSRDFVQVSFLTTYSNSSWLTPGVRLNFAFYLKGWGPPKSYFQTIFAPLVVYSPNRNDSHQDLLFTYEFPFGKTFIGFEYRWYIDSRKTNQRTGILFSRVGSLFLHYENDGLAGNGKDRFRTGSIGIHYLVDSLYALSVEIVTWTGETQNKSIRYENGDYPFHAKHGWKDLSQTLYGRYSHGIFRLTLRSLPIEEPDVAIGIDSEWIRHYVQNKCIHDLLPGNNPHYPPLDSEGYPFLKRPGQRIKSALPIFELGQLPFFLY